MESDVKRYVDQQVLMVKKTSGSGKTIVQKVSSGPVTWETIQGRPDMTLYLTVAEAASLYLTIDDAEQTYLTIEDAEETYLTSLTGLTRGSEDSDGMIRSELAETYLSRGYDNDDGMTREQLAETYLTIEDAGNTYLTIESAGTNLLSKIEAQNTYLPKEGNRIDFNSHLGISGATVFLNEQNAVMEVGIVTESNTCSYVDLSLCGGTATWKLHDSGTIEFAGKSFTAATASHLHDGTYSHIGHTHDYEDDITGKPTIPSVTLINNVLTVDGEVATIIDASTVNSRLDTLEGVDAVLTSILA